MTFEEVPEGSTVRRVLMGEHYLKLVFTLDRPIYFRIGDYVDTDFGRFELTKQYKPKYNTSTSGYDYTLQLDAYYIKWKNKKVRYMPEYGAKEVTFKLTANIDTHLNVVLRTINAIGAKDSNFRYNGQPYVVQLLNFPESKRATAKYYLYDKTDIISALDGLAQLYECEWWVEDNIIFFGKCEIGSSIVDISIESNADEMTRSEADTKYATRLYAFGSTRNLPHNFEDVGADVTIDGVVEKRLTLPTNLCPNGYLEDVDIQNEAEAIEGVIVNDDIYPKVLCEVSAVETYTDNVENEDGTITSQTFYRLKDSSGFQFSEDMILEGESLHILFQSGSMNGMDFECHYDNEGKYYEVIANEDYGRLLPDATLHPVVGMKFVLYNWDATKIEATGIIDTAKKELYDYTLDYLNESKIDPSTYECTLKSVWVYNDGLHFRNFDMGTRVNLINDAFFEESRTSRIIGFEIKLDKPYDTPKYTVGEKAAYSRRKDMERQIEAVTVNGNAYVNSSGTGGGTSIYVIKRYDGAIPSDYNVFSAKRSMDEFLSRKMDDIATGLITFVKGMVSKARALFEGDVEIQGLLLGSQARLNTIKSDNFTGNGMADTGYMITSDDGTGSSMAVFDYLTIRKKMIVNSLEIKETHFSAGDVAHTLAAAEIARTDYLYVDGSGRETLLGYSQIKVPWLLRGAALLLGKESFASRRLLTHYKKVRMTLTNDDLSVCNRVRCYFLAKDGDREIENWFRVGDLVRCQTWNIVKTRRETFIPDLEDHAGNVYWWRKITDVSWNTGVQRYVAKDASGQPTENTTTDINSAYVNEGGIPRIANNGTYGNPDIKHSPKTIDGNTYHWFDVAFGYDAERSGEANWCDRGSDLPAAGDKVIQFGNTTDPDRMNIFMIEVNGAGNPDAPDWKMYRGVYTFNLTNCWWGGESCRKTKWSVATSIEAYAPQFKWITEYGIARQVFVRDEVYWNKIPFERDDDWSKAISSYPDYSDDIVDANGRFVSRADGSPKNYVRKCRYYEQVSHNGSAWLCSVAESFYWRSADGRKISANTDGAEYVRNYTYEEPSAESNNWTEQVKKGDPGAFKSTVFCRTNKDISAYQPQGGTYDNPIPTSTKNAQGIVDSSIVWTDGIPDGTAILWASTAWFYSDGTHQDWTTPRQQTDTETLDIEFSPNATQPLAPVGTAANKDTSSIKTQRHNQGGENMGWFDPNDTLTGWTWSDMKWRAERKIKNGVYYGSWAITRIKGENSVRIDLVNDNESMLYTSGGTLVSGNVLSTARLFDGATDVSTSADWTMTAVGCTMSSGNSRNIVVTGMTAATGYVNVQAVYTDKNGTVYKKTKQLTLKKLVDVDKYDLDITPNSIAYNATKDKPATSLLTIKVWKMTVDGNRALSNPPSGYGVYVNNVKQTESSTGTYYYTTDNSAVSSVQVKIAKDSNLDDVLDSETIPVNKAEDGAGGDTPMQAFKWNDSPTSAPALPTKGSYNNGWTATAPNRPTGTAEYHLWMTQAVKHTAADKSVSYDAWGAAVRISGDKGEPGVDSADREWIYIGSKTYSSPYSGTHPKNITKDKDGTQRTSEYIHSTDDFVPYGWQDTAIATDDTNNKFVYASWRDKAKGATTWGDFTDPILWSNWGVQGIDGDGVQYVYKLFDHELTDAERVSNIPAKPASQTQGEWIPSGWSDDPLAPTSANPYCYCSVIKKIGGSWSDTFEKLGLWSKWAKDADVWTIDSDGYWCKNGVRYVTPDGNYVLAEGKNGTGVELKGSVDVLFNSEATQGQTSLEGVSAKIGECYSVKSTGHLYFYDSTSQESDIPSGWVDVGEFKGEKGDNSYVHIAYARSVSFDGSTITAVTGFIVDSNGSDYEWMGICTDNNPLDPGASGRDAGSDLANARFYKWNYMKGKDGNGYERVYLLAKDGIAPTVNQNSYTVTSDKPNYGHTDRTKGEFWPQVANYDSSQMQTNYWTDDPQSNPSEAWPVLWWAERKFDGNTHTWGNFCPPTEHNRFTSELAITLTRDNLYTEASWNTYAAIGHTESFVKRSGDSDFTVCRVGDRFVVSGKSSDKGLYHTATYKCTSVSASNIAGICISHLHDGKGISNVARTFAISNVGTTESETTEPVHHGSWTANSPAVTEQYPYLWAKEVVTFSDNTTTTKYYCIGSRGDNGVDAKDFEWVYIRTKTSAAPTILNDDTYVDTNGKDYTADDHLPRVIDNPNVENNGSRYQCTDDPKGVDETWKYEWESKRTKGSVQSDNSRAWNYYMGVMKLHNNFAESAFIIDLSNDNDQFGTDSDSKVIEAQTRSTAVMLYDGATRQVLNESDGVSAVLKYIDDDTAVPSSVAEVSCVRDTQDTTVGYVRVTFKKDVTFAKSGLYAYITAKCAKGEKNATFTVRKLMSGQAGISPTIYQLAPSLKTFSFGRNASNILTPNSRTVAINATKTTGNTTSSATTSGDGLTYKWGFDEETATSEHSGLTLGTSITVSNTDAASHYQVWVELSSGDKETLPIVKDGINGDNGQSTFKSTVFTRTNETPLAPDATYGSYANPNPPESGSDMWPVKKSGGSVVSGTFWHDGIPAGEARLWASTRIFASDGQSPQQSSWTTPSPMTDTADFDVEFSSVANPNPPSGHPNTNTQWSNTSDATTIWMATSEKHNGVWSEWQVSKIKGEQGEPGGKATGKVQWFLALGGSTRPAVPAVTIVNNVPKSTIGGQTVSWNEGSDPSWSETKKYLYEIDYFTLSDGTGYWSEPFFLSEWAEQGPQGEAAWAFSANPANVIITQSLNNNLTSFSSATVSFAAKKGRESATITSIAIPTGQQALSNEFNATIGTGDDANKVIVSSPKTHGTPEEYYTEGSFKVVVNAQAPDGSTSSQEVTVLCYANLLGTWKRKVVGDAESVAADAVAYIYDPKNPNQVVKMETFGDYVRSSEQNSAKLERDTTDIVKNIDNTAFVNIEGTQVALSDGEYIVQLKVDTTGNYVFDFAGFHYEGGEQFIEQRITVDNSGTYTITLHDEVQSGNGVATMLYIGRVFNVSSEIKQKAGNIMLQVNDKVNQSDFNIFSNSIQSSVKNISPSKNLLKGSLSAKGWSTSNAGAFTPNPGIQSAVLTADGYISMADTDTNTWLSKSGISLSTGKKYTLSFLAKVTTAISYKLFFIYNSQPQVVGQGTVPSVTSATIRRKVTIENIPLASTAFYLTLNCKAIKQPQLEEGDTATDFIADSTEISSNIIQIADNIQLFVTKGLSNTGIDITNGTIMLQANKVTFCDANGGNTDKILIDPTNGTLHAVDGHFSGEITATSGSITGQMNIASGGSIIVGKEDSYRIKIAQSSNRGYITMLDGEGDNIILINYNTGKNAGQIKVSEADAQHERYTFIDPYSMESVYNYKNASGQWNGDHSHITTQVGRRMAETEYDDLYVSGGFVARRHIKIGVGTTGSGSSEQSVVNLRAYNDNQESAWPVCSLDPTGANWMDKGHVHVMTMGELKVLLENPNSIYSSHLANYAVMLTRINGN